MVSWLGSDVKFFRRKLCVFVMDDAIGQGGGGASRHAHLILRHNFVGRF